jgi:hypothetical protein
MRARYEGNVVVMKSTVFEALLVTPRSPDEEFVSRSGSRCSNSESAIEAPKRFVCIRKGRSIVLAACLLD